MSLLFFQEKLFQKKSSHSIETLVDILSTAPDLILPFEQIPPEISIDLSKIGIWIDPIDGTQQYIDGTDGVIEEKTGIAQTGLPTALVLIGCFDTENGQAVIGVINRAFHEKINPRT